MVGACLEEVQAAPPLLRRAPPFLAFLQPGISRSAGTATRDSAAVAALPGFGGSLRLLTGKSLLDS